MPITAKDIMAIATEEKVELVRLQFTDILGTTKNITISAQQLGKALDNQIMFDGSSIQGFVRIQESDMFLCPTQQRLPSSPGQATASASHV